MTFVALYFDLFVNIIDFAMKFILIYIMILSIKALKKYLKNNWFMLKCPLDQNVLEPHYII